jgi:hypothetical protein
MHMKDGKRSVKCGIHALITLYMEFMSLGQVLVKECTHPGRDQQ